MKIVYFMYYFIFNYKIDTKFNIKKLIYLYRDKILLKLFNYSKIKNIAMYNV